MFGGVVRFSLRMKISGLVLMCSILGVVYGGVYLRNIIQRAQEAQNIVSRNILFKATSEVIHQLQVERGKTSLYLNNSLSESELREQRQLVDKSTSEYLKDQGSTETNKKSLADVIKEIRQKVDNHAPTSEVIAQYTEAVVSLINIQVQISKDTTLDGIEMHLVSINLLELAKEYAGRTRANMTPLLGARKPLTSSQVALLQDLRSRVYTNLQSPVMVLSPEAQKGIANLLSGSSWQKMDYAFTNLLAEFATGNFDTDPKNFYQDITQNINGLRDVAEIELRVVAQMSEKIWADANQSMWITILVLSVAMCLVGGLSVIIIRGITRPINQAVESLNSASDSIALSSGQVTEASHQVSSSTVESASALEEIVASVEELNSIVKQNAARAGEGAKISSEGKSKAEEGQREIATLIKAMGGIATSSRRIEEIINVIDDIAFQTNLLALNAAVEAARAGEQGKGFAVVAEAVRALAQRSSVAAKDISNLIKESVIQVDNGTKVADSSELALNSIVEAIHKIAVLNDEISAASSEQSAGIQQITKAMAELDMSTQANASVAEEVSASADQMTGQVHRIGDLVHALQGIVDGAA